MVCVRNVNPLVKIAKIETHAPVVYKTNYQFYTFTTVIVLINVLISITEIQGFVIPALIKIVINAIKQDALNVQISY